MSYRAFLLRILVGLAALAAPGCAPGGGTAPERRSESAAPRSPKEEAALLQDRDAQVRLKASEKMAAYFRRSRPSPKGKDPDVRKSAAEALESIRRKEPPK